MKNKSTVFWVLAAIAALCVMGMWGCTKQNKIYACLKLYRENFGFLKYQVVEIKNAQDGVTIMDDHGNKEVCQ